jgi:hypothetical protein
MAWIVADSFDYYSSTSDIARSVWDSVANPANASLGGGRFAGGQCLVLNSGFFGATKNFGNEPTVYIAVAYLHSGALSGGSYDSYFRFSDGANAQFAICFMQNGSITLKSGSETGTIIATYASAFNQDVWTHFQFQVLVDPAAGTFNVRKNGGPTNSFSATGLNTRGGSANSYVNSLYMSTSGGAGAVDDLLVYSASGAAPNTWVGDVRGICLPAVADTAQKQFVPFLSAPVAVSNDTGTAFNAFASANFIYWTQPWVPSKNGTLSRVGFQLGSTPAAGSMQYAIYDNSGTSGQPGKLLGVCSAIINPAGGAPVYANAVGTIPLVATATYYAAVMANMVIQPAGWNSPTTWYQNQTYASGFPATAAPTGTLGGTRLAYWIEILGNNAQNVSEYRANGDTDYVLSANVNDEDLYGIAPLPVTPFAIVGVVTHVYIRKSDAGTRQGQLRVKSGATEVFGVDTAVSSTWSYLARVDAVDPNTSAAWTLAAVNALQIGQKVTL